jgi:hypothetical protein
LTPISSPTDLALRVRDLLHDLTKLEQLDLAELVVEASLDLTLLAELAASGLLHGLFDGANDDVLVDALVLGDLLDLSLQTGEHDPSFSSPMRNGASGRQRAASAPPFGRNPLA